MRSGVRPAHSKSYTYPPLRTELKMFSQLFLKSLAADFSTFTSLHDNPPKYVREKHTLRGRLGDGVDVVDSRRHILCSV